MNPDELVAMGEHLDRLNRAVAAYGDSLRASMEKAVQQ